MTFRISALLPGLAVVGLVIATGFHPKPLRAQVATPPPSVIVSLVRDTVTLGEPIVVRYTITNNLQAPIEVDRGDRCIGAFSVQLLDSNNQPTPSVPDNTVPNAEGGTGVSGTTPIDAGASVTGYLVAGRFATVPQDGQYTIAVQLQLPYWVNLPAASDPDGTLTTGASLPVAVLPADQNAAQITMAALLQQVAQNDDTDLSESATQQLFTMPESVGLATWQQMIADSSLDEWRKGLIVQELARLGTSTAVSLMGTIVWDQQQPDTVRFNARFDLRELHDATSDPSLQQQIENLFVTNEGFYPSEGTPGQGGIISTDS